VRELNQPEDFLQGWDCPGSGQAGREALQRVQERKADFSWGITLRQRGGKQRGHCPGGRLPGRDPELARQRSSLQPLSRQIYPPQTTYLISGRNFWDAGSGHLSAFCLFLDKGVWRGFFNADQGSSKGDAAWWSFSLCFQLFPPPKTRRRSSAPGPAQWAAFGLQCGDGSRGMSLKAEAEMPSGQVALGHKITQRGLYWPRNDQEE